MCGVGVRVLLPQKETRVDFVGSLSLSVRIVTGGRDGKSDCGGAVFGVFIVSVVGSVVVFVLT